MRQESIPPFNEIEPKQVVSGFQKFLVNYETGANSLLDKLDTEKGYTKTFESVFDPIEKLFTQLDNAYKTSRHLAFVNPYSKYHIGFTRVIVYFTLVEFVNRIIHKRFYIILADL
jgi:Zn-dependent oligopeptidase